MYDSSGVLESWRICFWVAIGVALVCVIWCIFKTCRDIAICKDDYAIPTPPFRSAEDKVRHQIVQRV